jgi:type IV pilus assembly protein PilB
MNERVSGKPSGLAGRLVVEGIIDADQATRAQAEASSQKVPFVRYLVDEVKIDSRRLVEIASQEFGAPRFDIDGLRPQFLPQGLVEPDLVIKHHALPLYSRGKRLFIAVSDPTNLAALDEIKFHTGLNTEAILVDESSLQRAINDWSEGQDDIAGGLDDLESAELDDIDVGCRRRGRRRR